MLPVDSIHKEVFHYSRLSNTEAEGVSFNSLLMQQISNLMLAYLPISILRDHTFNHELMFCVSHLILLITTNKFKSFKIGCIPFIKIVPRFTSKNKELNHQESKYILFVTLSTLSLSLIARVIENAFHPLPAEHQADTLFAILLLWRQILYTTAPFVQILLNEYQQKVPNLPFTAMHLRAAIVFIQSIFTILGIEVFGGLRLAVFIRDGVFYIIVMVQIQVYNKLRILNSVQEINRVPRLARK
jgi:hypothetical protein